MIDSRVFCFPNFDRKKTKQTAEPRGIEHTTLCSTSKPIVRLRHDHHIKKTDLITTKKTQPRIMTIKINFIAHLMIVSEIFLCYRVRGQRSTLRIWWSTREYFVFPILTEKKTKDYGGTEWNWTYNLMLKKQTLRTTRPRSLYAIDGLIYYQDR